MRRLESADRVVLRPNAWLPGEVERLSEAVVKFGPYPEVIHREAMPERTPNAIKHYIQK